MRLIWIVLSVLLFQLAGTSAHAGCGAVEADNPDLNVKEDIEKHQLEIDWRCPYSFMYPKRMTVRKHGHLLLVKVHLATFTMFRKNPKVLQPPYIVALPSDVDCVKFGEQKKVIWQRQSPVGD